jgi:lysophospholipase L1-like esterase
VAAALQFISIDTLDHAALYCYFISIKGERNMRKIILPGFALLIMILIGCQAQQTKHTKIRVACLGASNTRGYQIPDTEKNAFPGQLQRIAGDGWDVRNYGAGGTTVTKDGSTTYWISLGLREAVEFEPDIVIFDFGWNDMKVQNQVYMPDHFVNDYTEMIGKFKALPGDPKIIVIIPALLQDGFGGIVKDYKTLKSYLTEVVEKNHTYAIDMFDDLSTDPSYYNYDLTHFSIKGMRKVAEMLYEFITNNNIIHG